MSPSFSVVAAVNDTQILNQNLMRSPMIVSGKVPVLTEEGCSSAGVAYNKGMRRASSDYVIFAHQDVYFPLGWEQRLIRAIRQLEEDNAPWGALGVFGINSKREVVGRVWCSANREEFGETFDTPQKIVSLDEIVIVLKRSTTDQFDEDLPGFHFYGTDVILNLRKQGLQGYVFHGPIIHNTKTVMHLSGGYSKCYKYMQRKWADQLPLVTCVNDVTRWGYPFYRREFLLFVRQLLGRVKVYDRSDDPEQLALQLGFESAEQTADFDHTKNVMRPVPSVGEVT